MVQGKGKKNGYLTALTREEVLRIVVDAYRLRMETDHVARGEEHGLYWKEGGEKLEEGLVWVEGDVLEDFQRWLDLCEEAGVLPEWWRFEDRMEVLGLAVAKGDPESVLNPINQEKLIVRYEGDTEIRPALGILAELAVGYDGKGRAKTDDWYMSFSEFLDLHPEERARLIQGTVDAVQSEKQQDGSH